MIPASIAGKTMARGSGAAHRLALGISTREVRIASALPVNEGKQVDIEFADSTTYRFCAARIKNSVASCMGTPAPTQNFVGDKFRAEQVHRTEDGSKLMIRFQMFAENAVSQLYSANMLHALAQQVGAPLHDPLVAGENREVGLRLSRKPVAEHRVEPPNAKRTDETTELFNEDRSTRAVWSVHV
mmetsp:Transcript_104546/g.186030  ORF Transcript_104546/g.186030 Transcript_104546/m.186030 type:complete len:185 (+) Transcript_104546:152-706(+)